MSFWLTATRKINQLLMQSSVTHLSRKLERVFAKGVAKDAGNPSGAWHFTISTALGNDRYEENQHEYDEDRSYPLASIHASAFNNLCPHEQGSKSGKGK